MGTAGKVPLTGLKGSLRIWAYQQLLNVSLESLLPKVLGPQHSESSCADEARPLAQHRQLRFTVGHQGHHPTIHTDRHTVPPAIREVDSLRKGAEGVT